MNNDSLLSKFFHPIRVRFADTDLQGHAFFGSYFTFIDEGYMAYLSELGYSWGALGEMGLEIYYLDSGCQFKDRAYFEETLNVHARISKLGNSSMTAEMTIVRPGSMAVVAEGFIKAVMVDSETKKSTRIPNELREAVNRYQDV